VATDSTSPAIEYANVAGGEIYIPSGSSITSLTWYASPDRGTTWYAAEDSSSAAVTQTVAAGQCHPIPDALYGCELIQARVNAAGAVSITRKT
jgi:hypothetical protein